MALEACSQKSGLDPWTFSRRAKTGIIKLKDATISLHVAATSGMAWKSCVRSDLSPGLLVRSRLASWHGEPPPTSTAVYRLVRSGAPA